MKKPYALNRKMYQNIRKMDHGQMSGFLENLYREGFEDGKKAAEGLTGAEMREVILQIKGIGEKKADAIIEAVEAAMKERHKKADNK